MDAINGSTNLIDNNAVQSVFYIVYTNIFILGLFGNALVCYVVLRNRAMQTVTNLFITNLALSDILLCVLAVPFTPLYTFHGRWLFGGTICRLVPLAQGISVYISTLTLTSIAVDRYFVIVYPFRPRMKVTTCIAIVLAIWIFSILVTVPYGVYMVHDAGAPSMNTSSEEVFYYCEERWPNDDTRQLFAGVTSVLQFVVPFVLIAYCYICVSMKLNDRARSKPGCKSSKKEEADRERKRRTNRMLIAMVIIFLVSWLPLNVCNVALDFNPAFLHWPYYYLAFFVVHALAMSSTCYNPFLYAWLNESFRKEFQHVLPCFAAERRAASGQTRATTQQSALATSGVRDRRQMATLSTPPQRSAIKADCGEVESVVVAAVFDPAGETVRLKLIAEEEPPPYDSISNEE